MNTRPLISLIFVNYQSVYYLKSALESIFSFEKESNLFEIIVVNNDKKEELSLKKLQKRFPFILKENECNNGFGAGNNRGAQEAQGDILGFINPDVLWIKKSLHEIRTLFIEQENIGVLGMMLVDEKNQEEPWGCGYEPTLHRLFWNNITPKHQNRWQKSGLSFPDWVSGCGLFIRKDLFFYRKGFDEQFFLYFEDVDLCKKVREGGFLVARQTNLPLLHFGGKSTHSKEKQKNQFYISQKKYYKKHRPLWENIVLFCLHSLFRHKTS
ncbi:MAG: glycosyltransferase family 2 protein [Candidatus Moranbacteria bacterium]|nr:glycosyltransferase family 2 protein [Candidatus Moranbacteria bacterium]MDD3964622.1 glycosyltransferase family 2 protein [Candidatus Moranbacteria bacterium]